MRLTIRTNLAMRVLMFCAVNKDRLVHSDDIARQCNASANHLILVVNQLSQAGLIRTLRGRRGGVRLEIPAEEITIGRVFRAFEAGVPFAECFSDGENTCPLIGACRLRGAIGRALEAFYAELDQITLEELVCGNDELAALFQDGPVGAVACPA